MSADFDPDNPEDGHYWRGLPADEVEIFEDKSQTYGRSTLSELNGMPTMKGKCCARFFSSKGNAVAWAKAMRAGAKVLAVPMASLTHSVDYDVWPATKDVYITGEAARKYGVMREPDEGQ